MAFSTHGTHCYEVEVPLSVEYVRSVVQGGSYNSTPQYGYSRRAMKTYRYKGLTEAAVKAALTEKRAQYTRRFCAWKMTNGRMIQQPYSQDYFKQVAAFNVTRNAVVFDLRITVDEIVNIYSTTEYDLLTQQGRAALEAQFQRSSVPLCWVWRYKYDEPGEEE